jgi:hypothetical protein
VKFVLALALLTSTSAVDAADFRYLRALAPEPQAGVIAFEPDERMLAHTKRGFDDLRVLDARGEQIPWRLAPARRSAPRSVPVLDSGRQGPLAVALLDLGPRRRVYDRVDLEIPDAGFVGRVTVRGADRRHGAFALLSRTGIYDISGATHARSTTALFPPSDFRFLRLEATGVSRIDGATVSGTTERRRQVLRRTRLAGPLAAGRASVFVLDLGFPGVPVDELSVSSPQRVYERGVAVAGRDRPDLAWRPLARARIFRFPGSRSAPIEVFSSERYLRVTIFNGDDPPLPRVRILARGPSQALLLEPGQRGPFELLYGGPTVGAPSYQFARIPPPEPSVLLPASSLGAERLNARFEPPSDTRRFFERHDWLVEAALALGAAAVAVGGLLALRRA